MHRTRMRNAGFSLLGRVCRFIKHVGRSFFPSKMRHLLVLFAALQMRLASTSVPADWRDLIDDDVYDYTIKKASSRKSDKFEGDIAGLDASAFEQNDLNTPKAHNAVQDSEVLWPDGVVPYSIREADFTSSEVSVIRTALGDVMSKTCLKFVPLDAETDYIRFVGGRSGCYSYIGRVRGRQDVHLERGGCISMIGEVQHEVMHALGFYHEQARWDRDDFVTVYLENVESSQVDQFKKYNGRTFNLPYDYASIMHYGFNDFSADRKSPTILPKTKAPIGNRKVMSDLDVKRINILYGCSPPTRLAPVRVWSFQILARPPRPGDQNARSLSANPMTYGCIVDNIPCGESCYNPTYHVCVNGEVVLCGTGQLACGESCYDTKSQTCNAGKILTCLPDNVPCGSTRCYNPTFHACNGGNVIECKPGQLPCGEACYSQAQEICSESNVLRCIPENIPCGSRCYNPAFNACSNGKVVVCEAGQLPCGTVCYNQDQSSCLNGRVA